MNTFFTCESVLPGHPNKVADRISDEILDAYLKEDGNARCTIETLVTARHIVLAGEVKSTARPYTFQKSYGKR